MSGRGDVASRHVVRVDQGLDVAERLAEFTGLVAEHALGAVGEPDRAGLEIGVPQPVPAAVEGESEPFLAHAQAGIAGPERFLGLLIFTLDERAPEYTSAEDCCGRAGELRGTYLSKLQDRLKKIGYVLHCVNDCILRYIFQNLAYLQKVEYAFCLWTGRLAVMPRGRYSRLADGRLRFLYLTFPM